MPEDEQVNELIGKLSSTELYHGVKDTERHFAVLDFLRNDLIKHPSMVRLIRGFQVNCYLDLQLEKVALLMSRECEKIDIEFRITTSKALWNLGCKIEAKEQAVKFFSSIQEFDADYVNNACHILFELGIEGNVEHLEEIIRKAIRDVREMRHMLPRRSAEEQLQLTELETSLASKLGSIIGPEATAKEFKVANAVSSMRRHFYPSYSMV